MRTFILIFLMGCCSADDYDDDYEAGHAVGCEFVSETIYEHGRNDGAQCIKGAPSVLCKINDDDGEYASGWTDGCYECAFEAYEEGNAVGLLECDQ